MFLLERMNDWARNTPDHAAIVFEDETITFADLQIKIEQTVLKLSTDYGVQAGDRVAYLGFNHPNVLYLVFACSHLGAIFAPLNTRLAEEEYRFLVGNSEPRVCFFDANFADVVGKLNDVACRFVSSDGLEKDADAEPLPPLHSNEGDPLLLVYTSGTTGKPKGVLLSNAAVAANIENGNALYSFEPQQNILITLPLFHVGGLCILLLPALTHGATIYLHARFDPLATMASLASDNIATTILVPAQMDAMMKLDVWADAALSSMSHVVVGSSIIPKSQIEAWHAKNIPVSQVYGATETGPTAIGLPIQHAMAKEGSAGLAAKLCSIEVRRPDESECNIAENGDIWVRGPNILSGYWRNAEEAKKVLKNDWYNTGDIGHVDADGFYWIVDRSKDVIISGGENIYPAEVENVALQHPSIQAIAVVGRQDERWGETPVAAIELKEGAFLDEADFQNFFTDKIAKFKQPKSIVFFDKLPRNGMGKIEKNAVRKLVNASTEKLL